MSDLTRADLHSHSYYSLLRVPKLRGIHLVQDSALSPKLLVKIARRKKLGAIALTDHNNMNGMKPFLHYASKFNDIIPIVGQEVTKYDQNRQGWAHVLVYGLKKIPWNIRFKPLPEFLDYLNDNNAVYALAHPFDLSQSAPAGGYDRQTLKINFSVLKEFRMVETINGLQPKRHNYLAQIIARELQIPGIAGGDSHQPKMVGRCFTYVEGSTEDEILEYLRKVKKTPSNHILRLRGKGSDSRTWEKWFYYLFNNLDYNISYDIYRHLNPDAPNKKLDPVYDHLYYDSPMFLKILVKAAIPYIYAGLIAGTKIWVPRMRKNTYNRELGILRSIVDFQVMNKDYRAPPVEFPNSEKDLSTL
ncbi:MAG: PHP domain-containing protein [Candidatus Hodarchaeales archaeon]